MNKILFFCVVLLAALAVSVQAEAARVPLTITLSDLEQTYLENAGSIAKYDITLTDVDIASISSEMEPVCMLLCTDQNRFSILTLHLPGGKGLGPLLKFNGPHPKQKLMLTHVGFNNTLFLGASKFVVPLAGFTVAVAPTTSTDATEGGEKKALSDSQGD